MVGVEFADILREAEELLVRCDKNARGRIGIENDPGLSKVTYWVGVKGVQILFDLRDKWVEINKAEASPFDLNRSIYDKKEVILSFSFAPILNNARQTNFNYDTNIIPSQYAAYSEEFRFVLSKLLGANKIIEEILGKI